MAATWASFKKINASIGSVVLYFISLYTCIKEPALTLPIAGLLIGFILALYGLKKWNGTFKPSTNNQQES